MAHILRVQHLQGLINEGLFGDAAMSSTTPTCSTTDTMVDLIMDNIDADIVTNSTLDATEIVVELLRMMDGDEQSGEVRSSSSRPSLPLDNLSAQQIAEYLRNHLLQQLMNGSVDDREQSLRETVKLLVHHARRSGLQLHALLLLLADLLPQPNSPEITSRQVRAGANLFKDILDMLTSVYAPPPENDFRYRPFGIDDVAQYLAGLSELAIESMSFLENADFPFEDTESEPDDRATETNAAPDGQLLSGTRPSTKQGRETQSTTLPATSSPASSSSALPDRALQQD